SSSPTVGSNGTIYFGSDNKYLYAIKASGNLNWRFQAGGKIFSTPVEGPNGTILFGTSNGRLYSLREDGSVEWIFTSQEGPVIASPSISSNNIVYFDVFNETSYTNYLYSLTSDGSLRW